MARIRADVLLVDQGLAPSRTRAQALILAGVVLYEDGQRVEKAGQLLPAETQLRLKEQPIPFVSRGGLKLQRALDEFDIDVAGSVALDVGASTGGFTDCLLQRGASRVYAVDVGHNQLVWSLRNDPRVVCIERLNVRTMPPDVIGERVNVISIDVSFISLKLIIEPVLRVAAPGCRVIALVKPQFEVGRGEVGKGGIVRDPAARARVLEEIRQTFAKNGLVELNSTDSPIRGSKGNHEFLLVGRCGEAPSGDD